MRVPALVQIPLVAWLLALPGLGALLSGTILLVGDFTSTHPLLGEPATALALLVSAVALLGSAAFPIVLRRLAARDVPQSGPGAPTE